MTGFLAVYERNGRERTSPAYATLEAAQRKAAPHGISEASWWRDAHGWHASAWNRAKDTTRAVTVIREA